MSPVCPLENTRLPTAFILLLKKYLIQNIGASFFKKTKPVYMVIRPGIRTLAPPGARASTLGGSCGPVASLGMLIRRYLVPRGRGHTPQVVVEPFASPQRRRRPARSGAAAGGWKGGEGRESWKIMTKHDF